MQLHLAVVGPGQRPHKIEPQAAAGVLAHHLVAHAVEGVEDAALLVREQADAKIAHA